MGFQELNTFLNITETDLMCFNQFVITWAVIHKYNNLKRFFKQGIKREGELQLTCNFIKELRAAF